MSDKRGPGRPPKYDKSLDKKITLRVTPEQREFIWASGTADIWRDRMLLLADDPDLLIYVDQKLHETKKDDEPEEKT